MRASPPDRPNAPSRETLLAIEEVSVELPSPRGILRAVDRVSLSLGPGRTLGLVGESGSGKSMLSRAIAQLLPRKARLSGRVLFAGEDLTRLGAEPLRRLRGKSIAFVFQDPMTSLNPVLTVGSQIAETLTEHLALDGRTARERAVELLAAVGISTPEQRLKDYPHQFSGGMRQRVAIAIALIHKPRLLIADEPTTALDVTTQAQILAEVQTLCGESGTALMWITHDLAVVAGLADRIAVMYAGRIVEEGPTDAVLARPLHPYTHGLIGSLPHGIGVPLTQVPGMPPSPAHLPVGCAFAPRCPRADTICNAQRPVMVEYGKGRGTRCWHPHLETETCSPSSA